MEQSNKKMRVSGGLGRCMLPLLDALGWKGGKRIFLNALPYDYSDFSISDMMNTMANLGFKVNSSIGTLTQLDARLLPCLCLTKKHESYILINRVDDEYLCFKGDTSEFVKIKANDKKNTPLLF